jgi:hypothetical protein
VHAAIIAPSQLLPKYAVTGYHLALCHLVDSDSVYGAFYVEAAARGDFIILDNSAHELGEGLTSAMERASDLIQPTEVVLPDRLFNAEDTVDFARDQIGDFSTLAPRVMGVPQGTTIPEWNACCAELISLGVDTIGISKDYENWEGGLIDRVRSVWELSLRTWNPKISAIHMLGWGRQLWQLGQLTNLQAKGPIPIRGVDSGKPLVYAWGGIDLSQNGTPKYPKRVPHFFDLGEDDIPMNLALKNVNQFRTVAGDVPS